MNNWENFEKSIESQFKQEHKKKYQLPDWVEIWGLRLVIIICGIVAAWVFYTRFYIEHIGNWGDSFAVALVLGIGVIIIFKYLLDMIWHYLKSKQHKWLMMSLGLICIFVMLIDLGISNFIVSNKREKIHLNQLKQDITNIKKQDQTIQSHKKTLSFIDRKLLDIDKQDSILAARGSMARYRTEREKYMLMRLDIANSITIREKAIEDSVKAQDRMIKEAGTDSNILNKIAIKYPTLIIILIGFALTIALHWKEQQYGYLILPQIIKTENLKISSKNGNSELDDDELRIYEIVKMNPQLSYNKIAELTGISQSTVFNINKTLKRMGLEHKP